jgi:hypothetical protein
MLERIGHGLSKTQGELAQFENSFKIEARKIILPQAYK